MPPPDVIVCSTSSGGTQAGLIAGCTLLRAADTQSSASAPTIRPPPSPRRSAAILDGLEELLDAPGAFAQATIDVDDRFVGDGYGIPTPASTEAIALAARTRSAVPRPDLHGQGDGRTDVRGCARAS